MSTQTTTKHLWISAGGLVTCLRHGGSYLQSAIAHGAGEHITTPLDDWMRVEADTVPYPCETCA